MQDQRYLTTGDLAKLYQIPGWQIRRLFERGLLPPARRLGTYRAFVTEDLPQIEESLRKAGYLNVEVPHG